MRSVMSVMLCVALMFVCYSGTALGKSSKSYSYSKAKSYSSSASASCPSCQLPAATYRVQAAPRVYYSAAPVVTYRSVAPMVKTKTYYVKPQKLKSRTTYAYVTPAAPASSTPSFRPPSKPAGPILYTPPAKAGVSSPAICPTCKRPL